MDDAEVVFVARAEATDQGSNLITDMWSRERDGNKLEILSIAFAGAAEQEQKQLIYFILSFSSHLSAFVNNRIYYIYFPHLCLEQ